MDLISKEAARQAIISMGEAGSVIPEGSREREWFGIGIATAVTAILNTPDFFSELEKSVPRWISAKDKLPIKEGDYLCYYENGNITIRHCYAYDPLGFASAGFTYWMELPSPPAE